jgi:hypothetical protein
MERPHPKYLQRRQQRREKDDKKLEKLLERNKKMENVSQIWQIKFDDLPIPEHFDLKQRILINKMWVHIISYFHRTLPVGNKYIGIIMFRVPHSLHCIYKHILQQGQFKLLNLNTDPDEYMQHLHDKYGPHFFLKNPPFTTRNPHIVD